MKKLGIATIALAAVTAIVPLFTQCQAFGKALTLANGRTVPMKCHWTAEAALATAVPLAIAGVMMFLNHRKETHKSLSIMTAVLGVIIILLPTSLFGVCADQSMLCNMVMRPTLIMTGILVIVTSAAGWITTNRRLEAAV